MKRNITDSFWTLLRKMGFGPDPMKSPEVQKMIKAANKDGRVGFIMNFEVSADNEWLVTSDELPGLVTGGSLKDRNSIEEQVIDAIFTYFGVPPKYCDNGLFIEEKREKQPKRKVELPLQLIPRRLQYESI